MMTYYEGRETAEPEVREQQLMRRLSEVVRHACAHAPAIARQLEGIDPHEIRSRDDLARIPVLRKGSLLSIQQAQREDRDVAGAPELRRVFGGFSTIGWGQARRVFASPGPIYEPEGHKADYWGFARALYAAGLRPKHLIHNSFSYHFTPAGAMIESGAHALGCTVFPAGVDQVEQQLRVLQDLQPDAYAGTPSFLRLLLESAQDAGVQLPIQRAVLAGEAFPACARAWLAEQGVDVYQAYASADLGLIAYETSAREGLVLNEDLILEIVRPGTDQPVPIGEVGEVVITTLNPDYPLLRFGTGDLSAVMSGVSPCGRTNQRIRGWMGRADQTIKVRGIFVHPTQVAHVLARHPEVRSGRLEVATVDGRDTLVFKVLPEGSTAVDLADIAATLREITKLDAEVLAVTPADMPNDGKVIDDQRSHQ